MDDSLVTVILPSPSRQEGVDGTVRVGGPAPRNRQGISALPHGPPKGPAMLRT